MAAAVVFVPVLARMFLRYPSTVRGDRPSETAASFWIWPDPDVDPGG
jgi:hypothetical protein